MHTDSDIELRIEPGVSRRSFPESMSCKAKVLRSSATTGTPELLDFRFQLLMRTNIYTALDNTRSQLHLMWHVVPARLRIQIKTRPFPLHLVFVCFQHSNDSLNGKRRSVKNASPAYLVGTDQMVEEARLQRGRSKLQCPFSCRMQRMSANKIKLETKHTLLKPTLDRVGLTRETPPELNISAAHFNGVHTGKAPNGLWACWFRYS